MQKILIIDIGYISSNNRTPIISKIEYWQKSDCEITFFCTKEAKLNYEKYLLNIKYILISHISSPSNRLMLIYEYAKRNIMALFYINKVKNKFDVVYSISAVLDLSLFPFILKYFDKKFRWCVVFDNIVSFDGVWRKFIQTLAYIFFKLSLILLKKVDTIFAISDDLRQYLLKNNFDSRNVVVTGNAIEADLIREAQKNEKYNIDVLFVGRVNETKGIYDMLKVLQIVRKKYPNFQLAIMGRGDESTEKKFRNEITKQNLDKNVQLLGYKYGLEKFSIIKSSKLFLFLSSSESYGVALLEAVCCGVKAVTYDLEPYKKIYLNDEVVMVTKNDYAKVADEVLRIIDSSDFENKSGLLLLKKYSWDKIAEIEKGYFNT